MKKRYVYFIQECGTCGAHYRDFPLKIGVAADVQKRLAELQIGNPRKLRVLGVIGPFGCAHAYDTERFLHRVFRKDRMMGEWFALKNTPLRIRQLLKEKDIPIVEWNPSKLLTVAERDDLHAVQATMDDESYLAYELRQRL